MFYMMENLFPNSTSTCIEKTLLVSMNFAITTIFLGSLEKSVSERERGKKRGNRETVEHG